MSTPITSAPPADLDPIAARLEAVFAADGFAAPGVDALRAAAGVSLRTLYKRFPSREAMVLGALEHRHRSYLAQLAAGAPSGPGPAPALHLVDRLRAWMADRAPKGCLFVGALSQHPDSEAIRAAVLRHKDETRALLLEIARGAAPAASAAELAATADALFLIHEGQTAASVSQGADIAAAAARRAVKALFAEGDST